MKRAFCFLMVLGLLLSLMSFACAEQTWKCSWCGRKNASGYAYCPGCGTAKPSSNCCPSCGYWLSASEAGFAYCPNCGASLKGYASGTYALTIDRLSMNSGPGTKRYFKELGTYGKSGEWVHLVARAWDPNNGIWWFKVEYPTGSGFYGWTGKKRFDASTYNEEDLPIEDWY